MTPSPHPLGDPVCGPDIDAADWLDALPAERMPFVLAPSSSRGWFGGLSMVAFDPIDGGSFEDGIEAVGRAGDRAMASETPTLAGMVLDYEGSARILTYAGALVHTPEGWRPWGSVASVPIPVAGYRDPDMRGPGGPVPDGPLAEDLHAGMGREDYERAVEEVREAVADGHVYVLNLTYRIAGRVGGAPPQVFRALLDRGASSMSAALLTPERSVVTISPERFLAIDEGRARIEPIKGTRPRGATVEEDSELAAELAVDPKELAEHVMVVDMERNDLGRVCAIGSVAVDPLYEIVPTPYCYQLVSTVQGTLRSDVPLRDVLSATFPCGSITGAPKVSAMRHIERLERSGRGAYCGALVAAMPGALDSAVLIRTAEFDAGGVRYGTGAGITYDSDPAAEWLETLVKARPFTGSAGEAD